MRGFIARKIKTELPWGKKTPHSSTLSRHPSLGTYFLYERKKEAPCRRK
jgi:hypothetical protein